MTKVLGFQNDVLRAVFELVEGNIRGYASPAEIAELVLLSRDEIWDVCILLQGRGLLKIQTMDGYCTLTADGIVYLTETQRPRSSSHNNIVINGGVHNSQIQQGSHGSMQIQNAGNAEDLKVILDTLIQMIQAQNISNERKELAEIHAKSLMVQAKLPEQYRDDVAISVSWAALSRYSDLMTIVPHLLIVGMHVKTFFNI
jgi:hypothetical protein